MKFKAKDAKKVMTKIRKKLTQNVEIGSERHCKSYIRHFQDMLVNGEFTPRLKKSTVKGKRRKGLPFPETPLYGRGDRVKSSMLNGLGYFKTAKGVWRVRPTGKHKTMSMQKLFAIHEKGAVLHNGGKLRARKPIEKSVKSYKKSAGYRNINLKIAEKII